MKRLSVLFITSLLSGCVGLAVGTKGTFEEADSTPNISNIKNKFSVAARSKVLTKKDLIAAWGEPDATSTTGNCEVLTYYDGYSWSGVGAFVLFFPVPLLVPTGHDENRFYFVNGESVGLISEHSAVTGALGYACGSAQCGWLAGSVSKNPRKVEVNWCG